MLTATDLNTGFDAMRLEAAPSAELAPRLYVPPSVSEPQARPEVARVASRPAPRVEEDDFDSMWDEPFGSW